MSTPVVRSARILRNTLSNSVGRVVVLATTFVMTPFILGELGESAFGLWVLATVIVSYGALLDLGMGSAVIKHVADLRARQDAGAARELMATATLLYAGLSVVALALGAVVAGQAPRLFGLESEAARAAPAVIALVAVSFAINLATTPANAGLRGLQRYDLTNAVMVASALVTAGLQVLVLRRGGDVVAMVAVTVPVTLLSQLGTVLLLRRTDSTFALRWSPASRRATRQLTALGATISVSQLAGLLQKRSSEVIIAAVMSAAAVAPFALARRLSELPHVLSDQFIKVLLPVASEINATGVTGDLRRLYLVSTRITLGLIVPLALCAGFLAADLLELWVGASYRDEAVLVVVLLVASVVSTSQWPAGSVFQGQGRFGWFAVAALCSGVLNVVLSLLLIGPYGLLGVVLGTLAASILEAFGFALPYTLRRLGIRFAAVLREALLPAAVPGLPAVVVLLAGQRLTGDPSWLGLVGTGGLALAVYLAAYLAMAAAAPERAMAHRAFTLAWRALARQTR